MISILLLVFILQFGINAINTIGKTTVNDLLWRLFTLLPGPQSQQAASISTLRADVVRLNREMTNTSAQDDFAKWARLRRQHDKAKERYDSEARQQQSFRSTFDKAVSTLRWLSMQGAQMVCNFWFSSRAMFWLPQGWVPHAAEWVLALPRAPTGSVSVNVWSLACGCVAALLLEGLTGLWGLAGDKTGGNGNGMENAKAGDMKAGRSGEKKEL